MSRRPLALLVGLALSAACGRAEEAKPPTALRAPGANLLLVTIDTLRADRLGAYGDAAAATPAIDALAGRGAVFTRCYSSVPLTLPSHATMMAGRYPPRSGVRTNGRYRLPAVEATLAEALQAAGYDTGAAVSSYILGARFGLDQGFGAYDDALGDDLLRGLDSEIPAAEVTDRFLAWLAGAREPFFGWLHLYDPHLPYQAPEPWASRFPGDPYRAEIAYVDAQLARLFAALDAAGRRERTVVVLTSDHGESFGEHGEIGHGVLTSEEVLRVPLILAWGARLAGKRLDDRVRLVDLAPTLLDLLALPPLGPSLDGESLLPLLARPSSGPDSRPEVYFESLLGFEENHWAPITGLLGAGEDGDYKYLALPERRLFDLARDPGEASNLFAGERRRGARLDERLRALLADCARDGHPTDAGRELDAEDRAQLEALGYASAAGAESRGLLDPYRGVLLEQEIAVVQALVDGLVGAALEPPPHGGSDLGAAERALAALEARHPGVEISTLFALRHQLAAVRGDRRAAVAAIEAGMRAFPESERFPTLLAEYFLRLGDAAAAETHAARALELDPQASRAMIVRGKAADLRGDPAAAVVSYRQAAALEPKNAALERHLADALVRSGDLLAAADHYAALAAAGRLDPEALGRAALVADRLGRGDEAEALLERAIAADPRPVHRLTYALMLGRHGRVAEGRGQLERLLAERGGELTAEQRQLAEGVLRQWSGRQ